MQHLREMRGQEVASRLLDAYLKQNPPPLLILHGPDGTGKWSAAEAFILQRLCDVGTGCMSCIPCRKVLRGEHPDYIRFPEGKVAIGEPEKPEPFTVRWLLKTRICYTPFESARRFVLFPRADMILHEAESALLKTLEEPPEHTRFIFLVRELEDLSDAMASRGVPVPFRLLPRDEVRAKLPDLRDDELDILGGSFHLLPLLQSDLFAEMRSKINDALGHPQALLELESWIAGFEKKGFPGSDELPYDSPEIMDAFTLLLLRATSDNPEATRAIFDFKGDLHGDVPGLFPHILGRLFQKLTILIFQRSKQPARLGR